MKILCLTDTAFLGGSESDPRKVLAGVSRDVNTPSSSRLLCTPLTTLANLATGFPMQERCPYVFVFWFLQDLATGFPMAECLCCHFVLLLDLMKSHQTCPAFTMKEMYLQSNWKKRSSIPSVLQGKYRQAVSAKAGGFSPGSSSSSGGENKNSWDPEAEVRVKKQGAQCELVGEEGGFEEDGKMEEDEEIERMKKLDEREKKLQKQLLDIEKFTDMDQLLVDEQREECQHELQDLEQRRNDLLLEHQGMQKRSQKLQSLQDKKKHCHKDAVAWNASETRLQKRRFRSKNWYKSPRGFIWQRRIWMKKSEFCKPEKKNEAAVRHSP